MSERKDQLLVDEQQRLLTIQQYDPSSQDDTLDDLVKLASAICGVEISLVTILDASVQWFKAKYGTDLTKTPREAAFCNLAIEGTSLLEIQDTQLDERVAENPMVMGEPHIRFYAGVPIINHQGYPLGTLCVIDSKPKKLTPSQRDALSTISTLATRCLEKNLEKKKQVESQKLKDQFISLMSQEMLGPMNNILGLSEMILSKKEDQTHESLKEIKSSAEKLHVLINDLLDFQKIKDGKVLAQSVVFDLGALVKAITSTSNSNTDAHLKLNYDLSIPKHLLGDPQRVKQVLNKLVDFSNEKVGEGAIRFNTELVGENNEQIEVKFISSFKGTISEEIPSSPEDLFDQGGLSIARDLIKMLGGNLVVKSGQEKVTTTFTLKFGKIEEASLRKSYTEDFMPGFENTKVLLVDDLEPNRIILGKFLEKWGIEYDMAANGDEGVDLAIASDYDIILMDLRMPGTDGFEATKRIKKVKNVPIIALTASLSTFDDEAYLNSTIDDLLAKPFHPIDLKQKLHKLLTKGK